MIASNPLREAVRRAIVHSDAINAKGKMTWVRRQEIKNSALEGNSMVLEAENLLMSSVLISPSLSEKDAHAQLRRLFHTAYTAFVAVIVAANDGGTTGAALRNKTQQAAAALTKAAVLLDSIESFEMPMRRHRDFGDTRRS